MKNGQPVLLFFAAILLYFNSTKNQFVLDDVSAISENRIVQKGTDGLSEIFITHYRAGYWAAPGDLYRPLVLASFAIEYGISPNSPSLHHWINILTYGVLVLLLYYLSQIWFGKDSLLPFFIAVLFVFHPIHTEVVANIKSRDELYGLTFGLVTLIGASLYFKNCKPTSLILMIVSFLLALLSKESSIVFLLIVPLTGYSFFDASKKEILKTAGFLLAPILLFLVLRSNALANQNETIPTAISVFSGNVLETYLKAGYHLMLYLWKLVIPFPLSSQYPEYFTGLPTYVKAIGAIGLIFHAWLLYFGVKQLLKKQVLGFVILFYLITSALHSNIFITIGTQFGERLLFVPSVAFAIIVGMVIHKTPALEKLKYPVLGLLLFAYTFLVIPRNKEWYSNFSLYEADVQKQPNSAMLNYWYALELSNSKYLNTLNDNSRTKSLHEALIYLDAANKLKPEYAECLSQIGLVYYKLGDQNKALPYYEQSLAIGKGSVSVLNNVAAIYFGKQNFVKARNYYEQALLIDPYYKDAWGNLGITYAQLGDFNNAQRAFSKAIELSPKNAQFYFYMGMTLNQLSQENDAQAYFEKAFELDPNLKNQ